MEYTKYESSSFPFHHHPAQCSLFGLILVYHPKKITENRTSFERRNVQKLNQQMRTDCVQPVHPSLVLEVTITPGIKAPRVQAHAPEPSRGAGRRSRDFELFISVAISTFPSGSLIIAPIALSTSPNFLDWTRLEANNVRFEGSVSRIRSLPDAVKMAPGKSSDGGGQKHHHRSTLTQQNKSFKSKHASKGSLKAIAKGGWCIFPALCEDVG